MVTAGANQAFTNVAVALLDASDKVVLFSPYYFNHMMAIQVPAAFLCLYRPCTKVLATVNSGPSCELRFGASLCRAM